MPGLNFQHLGMKPGEKFPEHVQRARFVTECFNVEYERLEALLTECHHCIQSELDDCCEQGAPSTTISSFGSCPVCDEVFLKEVTQQVSVVADCFASCARRLLRPRYASGFQRYLRKPRLFLVDSRKQMIEEARNLIIYIAGNAIATRKLLKKYEKERCRRSNNNLGTKLQGKRIELLKSPWLIELCAFQLNATSSGGDSGSGQINGGCSYSFEITGMNGPSIACTLLKSVNLDFNLTCPICLDTVFDPIALGCSHIFCNSCACNSASVPTIAGAKAANQRAKCPLCRQVGVYANSVHLIQLGLLLKKRCKEFWKERLVLERMERVKQAKQHWDQQSRLFLGF